MTPSQRLESPDAATAAVVVSCDSHVGPRLREDLREYCPKAYLEQYDAFVAEDLAQRDTMRELFEKTGGRAAVWRCSTIRTCRPPAISTRPLACERWTPTESRPRRCGTSARTVNPCRGWGSGSAPSPPSSGSSEAFATTCTTVGSRISVRLIPNGCSASSTCPRGTSTRVWPSCIAARDAGLRVVNLPACSRPGVLEYNHPAWEPFWSACEDLGFTLATHSSGGPIVRLHVGHAVASSSRSTRAAGTCRDGPCGGSSTGRCSSGTRVSSSSSPNSTKAGTCPRCWSSIPST